MATRTEIRETMKRYEGANKVFQAIVGAANSAKVKNSVNLGMALAQKMNLSGLDGVDSPSALFDRVVEELETARRIELATIENSKHSLLVRLLDRMTKRLSKWNLKYNIGVALPEDVSAVSISAGLLAAYVYYQAEAK